MTVAVSGVLGHLLLTPPVPVVVVVRPVAGRVHTVTGHSGTLKRRRRKRGSRSLSVLVGHAFASLRSALFFRWALRSPASVQCPSDRSLRSRRFWASHLLSTVADKAEVKIQIFVLSNEI